MANSELSKLKILFIYDYFRNHVSVSGENSAVSASDLIAYLENKTGNTFERKSIYADINKINEYVYSSGLTDDPEWIYSDAKKYRRNELKDEILIDEARLIYDAINTTAFVDTGICKKVKKMFPEYFPAGYEKRALYARDEKIHRSMINWLNNFRECIDNKTACKIVYGYKLGDALAEKSEKIISPMKLDWDNNCYYLIAVDNAVAEKKNLSRDQELTGALKRYRLDRIDDVKYDFDTPYIDYTNTKIKKQELENFIDNSVSAYSSEKTVVVEVSIKGKTLKETLRAYSALESRLRSEIKIKNGAGSDKGILDIFVRTGDAPTLYTALFELSTFKDVEIEIKNDDIRKQYADYIRMAAKAAKLAKL